MIFLLAFFFLYQPYAFLLFFSYDPESMPCKMLNRSIIKKLMIVSGLYIARPFAIEEPNLGPFI